MSRLVLRDKVRIHAPPELVWPFIADPVMVMAWNPKLESFEPLVEGPPRVGYRYRAMYSMQGGHNRLVCEIEEHRDPQRLVICMQGGRLPPDGRIREAYDLSERVRGTLVRQTITLTNSGIPLAYRLLIKLIQGIGKPAGKTYLQQLKELVEQRTERDTREDPAG